MAKKKVENLNFEEALSDLESIVQTLEQGDVSLDESMTLFERGLKLSQHSQTKLKDAEQKVQILTENMQESQLQDFDSQENNQ